VDYERYPEFVPGIRLCRVRSAKGEKHVEYELDLGIRRIKYTLRHEEQRPRRVSWSLVSGDMMKVSNGSWELSEEKGKTRAVYSVEIQISRPPLVPQALVNRVSDELTKIQLPKTLEAFKARAEKR
jgi:ribosome-associated toxin RatA of RatAB toxin-antitoxin module